MFINIMQSSILYKLDFKKPGIFALMVWKVLYIGIYFDQSGGFFFFLKSGSQTVLGCTPCYIPSIHKSFYCSAGSEMISCAAHYFPCHPSGSLQCHGKGENDTAHSGSHWFRAKITIPVWQHSYQVSQPELAKTLFHLLLSTLKTV